MGSRFHRFSPNFRVGPESRLKRRSKLSAKARSVRKAKRPVERPFRPIRTERNESDCTNTSSSFGDAMSPKANGEVLDEVQSQLQGDAPHEETSDTFRTRQKRLTAHWRKFIHPLTWRCKWMELQMQKLRSQAAECDRELARYEAQGQSQSDKAMKRKKRKRVEDTVDTVSYMSNHNVFSYYENKLILAPEESVVVDPSDEDKTDYCKNYGFSDVFWLKFLEEEEPYVTLHTKAEKVQYKVWDLKSRVDKVIAEKSAKVSSMDWKLEVESLPIRPEGELEQYMANPLMTNDAVPSHGALGSRPKKRRRVTFITNVEDEMQIDNEHANEELHNIDNFRDQFGKTLLESAKEQKVNHQVLPSELDPMASKAKMKKKRSKRKSKRNQRACA